MKTQFTKGPWKVESFEYECAKRYGVFPENGDQDAAVAEIFHSSQSEANARLIAAAPELCEALESILNIIHVSTGVYGYHLNGEPSPWSEFKEVIENADMCLEKARGES